MTSTSRTIDRQSWWIEYGAWMRGHRNGPLCIECADTIPIERVLLPSDDNDHCDDCLEELRPYPYGRGCPICHNGWRRDPVNDAKGVFNRRVLCEKHRQELLNAEREYRAARKRAVRP